MRREKSLKKTHVDYSEEHIKQMTDPMVMHNQWGVAGEPKKVGYIDTLEVERV